MPTASNVTLDFSLGLVESRDPSTLRPGELQQAIACEYRPGTTHLHKQYGRTHVGTTTTADVKGIQKLQYDTSTDKLAAVSNGAVYESNVSAGALTFAATLTGLSSTAVPQFCGYNDHWLICNGVDANYIREPNPVNITGWTFGNWRRAGMMAPADKLVIATVGTPSNAQHVATSSGTGYTTPTNVTGDTDLDTYAYCTVSTVTSKTTTFAFAAGGIHATGTGRLIHIVHGGLTFAEPPDVPGKIDPGHAYVSGTQKIEVSYDNGSNWTTVSQIHLGYGKQTTDTPVGDAITVGTSTLVRCTVIVTTTSLGAWAQGWIYAIWIDAGAGSTAFTTTNTVHYGYTEVYIDSDNVEHESNMSSLTELAPQSIGFYGVTITVPLAATPTNAVTQKYRIYRSLDEVGGGWPFMYQVREIVIANPAITVDTLDISLTLVADQGTPYPYINVLYPTGESIAININTPPPLSKMAIPYLGSVVYVPTTGRRLYYSLPSSITSASLEKVPEFYYLEFESSTNDDIRSIVRTNNGRTLLVLFETYTMMVSYLPQAADASTFDQRVTEYVSTQRGAAGVGCAVEVDLGGGRTVAVMVDALGIWATDGVSELVEWSRDIDWNNLLLGTGITLSNIELRNNPEMRRVEMTFKVGTIFYDYHFFYGRMKQDGDGKTAPIITGPHQIGTASTGVRCKHYNTVGGQWEGWSGSAVANGKVYLERRTATGAEQVEDESNAYNGSPTNAIPYQVKTGDLYFGGFGRATIAVFGYPKFGGSSAISITLVGDFNRDGSPVTSTVTKTYATNSTKKVYWMRYGDRHTLTIKDISTNDLPALIGYEVELRDAGVGRDI